MFSFSIFHTALYFTEIYIEKEVNFNIIYVSFNYILSFV